MIGFRRRSWLVSGRERGRAVSCGGMDGPIRLGRPEFGAPDQLPPVTVWRHAERRNSLPCVVFGSVLASRHCPWRVWLRAGFSADHRRHHLVRRRTIQSPLNHWPFRRRIRLPGGTGGQSSPRVARGRGIRSATNSVAVTVASSWQKQSLGTEVTAFLCPPRIRINRKCYSPHLEESRPGLIVRGEVMPAERRNSRASRQISRGGAWCSEPMGKTCGHGGLGRLQQRRVPGRAGRGHLERARVPGRRRCYLRKGRGLT